MRANDKGIYSMTQTVFLLPDTNFFIQCKDIADLSWQEFTSYDCVELIITRPVQAELDNQKGKGNGRVSKRARKASAMIKSLLISDDEFHQIRSTSPKVIIRVRQDLKPDIAFNDELMYTERDDQLVGITSTLRNAAPQSDVFLLTHDIGPIASAKTVGVRFYPIPDTWLLPPESDDSEKRVSALQVELDKYKKTEPEFEIQLEIDGSSGQKINLRSTYYAPISDSELDTLTSQLQLYFPQDDDFGPTEQPERPKNSLFGGVYDVFQAMEVFKPTTEEAKDKYKKEYQNWIKSSRKIFSELHDYLNHPSKSPFIKVGLKNTGNKPSEDNLITFSCRGNFKLLPTSADHSNIDNSDLVLSAPPIAPKGGWKNISHWISGITNHEFADHLTSGRDRFHLPAIQRHDPNGFYWKPVRPNSSVSKVSLECDQWRHHVDWEWFSYHLQSPYIEGNYTGVFEVELHAKNMSVKFEKRYYVNLDVDVDSCVSMAEKLINNLLLRKTEQ